MVVTTGRRARARSGERAAHPAHRKTARVLVQGVNLDQAPHPPDRQTTPGGIVEKEASLHISNLAHIDPKLDLPTRVGYRVLENGRKVRFAKRSGEVIDV